MIRIQHPLIHALLLFLAATLLSAAKPAASPLEVCRQELTLIHGFDVIKYWLSGAQFKGDEAVRFLGSHYENEALNIARTLNWMATSPTESRRVFKEAHDALEGKEDSTHIKNARYSSTVKRLQQELPNVPGEVWAYLSEWKEQSKYPVEGTPPSRNQVIQRIKMAAISATNEEKMSFLDALKASNYLTLNIQMSGARNWQVSEAILKWNREKRVVERFLQTFLFEYDRQLGVLPIGSYPVAKQWKSRLVQALADFLVRDSNRGTYYDEAYFKFVNPILSRTIGRSSFFGLKLEPYPLAKKLLLRTIASAFVGEVKKIPKAADLQDDFTNFLRQQLGTMALQLQIETPLEIVALGEVETQEEPTADSSAVIAPNEPVTFVVPSPKPDLIPSDIIQPPIPEEVAPETPLEVALIQAETQDGPLTTTTRRRRIKPAKTTDAIVEDAKIEQALPTLQIPHDEIIELMVRFTPTDWHARIIRKQVAALEHGLKNRKAIFDREMQSIALVLTAIELSERAQDAQHGRHLKSLSQPGLYEIKPQGRSQVRVVLGLGTGGYQLLRILPKAHNNDNDSRRQLNRLADEFASLK